MTVFIKYQQMVALFNKLLFRMFGDANHTWKLLQFCYPQYLNIFLSVFYSSFFLFASFILSYICLLLILMYYIMLCLITFSSFFRWLYPSNLSSYWQMLSLSITILSIDTYWSDCETKFLRVLNCCIMIIIQEWI